METTQKTRKIFSTDINREQATGTGMAMVLLLLIIGISLKNMLLLTIAIPTLILTMTVPMLFYPIAIVWFGLSNILGAVMSKIILTVLFLLIVVPMSLIRKMLGKDALQLKSWKKGDASVLRSRNHTFTAADLEKPY